jgi:hypothetical protein
MIDLLKIVQTTEHALFLLEDVAGLIPGAGGLAFKAAILAVKSAFNTAGIKGELEAIQQIASAQAQKIADEWPSEPTKPE